MSEAAIENGVAKLTRRTWVRWIKTIAAPIAPAIFGLLYQPINSGYVVKKLGCGCVDGFNANSFNGILFPCVWVGSVFLLVWASWRLRGWKHSVYVVCGLIIQGLSCYFAWKYSLWR